MTNIPDNIYKTINGLFRSSFSKTNKEGQKSTASPSSSSLPKEKIVPLHVEPDDDLMDERGRKRTKATEGIYFETKNCKFESKFVLPMLIHPII